MVSFFSCGNDKYCNNSACHSHMNFCFFFQPLRLSEKNMQGRTGESVLFFNMSCMQTCTWANILNFIFLSPFFQQLCEWENRRRGDRRVFTCEQKWIIMLKISGVRACFDECKWCILIGSVWLGWIWAWKVH